VDDFATEQSEVRASEVEVQRGQELLRLRDVRREVRCVECDRLAVGPATGWRASIGGFDDEPVEVFVFCPDCAARQFGEEPAAW
jgi:hypothetical protein